MSFEVCPAQPTDTEELLTLYEEARAYKIYRGDTSWGTEPFTFSDIDTLVAGGEVFIAKVDDKPAACAVLNWEDTEHWGATLGQDNEAGYIHRFATRDAFRGQQIGNQLLDWANNKARREGKKYLRLSCRTANVKLCEYYERQGFSQIGQVEMKDTECALYQRSVF